MDTSTKYIEMCRAAEEIQEIWEPAVCDWRTNSQKCMMLPHACRGNPLYVDKENDFWLPRQDQLQDLLDGDLRDIAEGFYDYMTVGGYNYEYPEFNDARCKEFGSMEQLWLAYVMESKYSKQWDGTAWIDPNAQRELIVDAQLADQINAACRKYKFGCVLIPMKPKYLLMNPRTYDKIVKMWLKKDGDALSRTFGGQTVICGLEVIIKLNVPNNEFQITGVPL